MTENNGKHLPQIEWFYDGYVYPFIGNADLKTLIQWRTDKLNSDSFWSYNKDARTTYTEHLACIEKCCRILFSNPNPEFSINELTKQQEQRELQDLKAKERTNIVLSRLAAQDKEERLNSK